MKDIVITRELAIDAMENGCYGLCGLVIKYLENGSKAVGSTYRIETKEVHDVIIYGRSLNVEHAKAMIANGVKDAAQILDGSTANHNTFEFYDANDEFNYVLENGVEEIFNAKAMKKFEGDTQKLLKKIEELMTKNENERNTKARRRK
jgi:hypothetical protein